MRCECKTHPSPHPPVFLPKVTRIFGPFLLVDGRALRQPATHFYWSTGGETGNLLLFDDSQNIEGSQRILYPVSRAYTCQIFSFFYSLLGNEPICSASAATNYPSLRDPPNGCQGHLRPCLSPPDRSMVTVPDSNDVRTRSTFIQLLA